MPGVDAKGPDALRPPDSVVAFFVYASDYWALLPLVVRQQISGGPALYGVLLGAIGAVAVGAAFILPRLKAKLGPDGIVAGGTVGTAAALVLFRLAREPAIAIAASLHALAGTHSNPRYRGRSGHGARDNRVPV